MGNFYTNLSKNYTDLCKNYNHTIYKNKYKKINTIIFKNIFDLIVDNCSESTSDLSQKATYIE